MAIMELSDIVVRLRERSGQYDEYAWHCEIELEAAKEIERLRDELAKAIAAMVEK